MENNIIDNQEVLKTGLKIIINNASRFLEYYKVYRVLIYVVYSYVIYNLANYLSRNYTSSKRERDKVVR